MRQAGMLLPVFSLPNKYGIGCFSKEALTFIDFLKASRLKLWQILPLGPTGYGNSPYQTFSTFAISPMFIDLEQLVEEGELLKEECTELLGFSNKYVDYDAIIPIKMKLLRKAYKRRKSHKALEEFAKKESYWLDMYALFMDLHERLGDVAYTKWEDEYKNKDWTVLDAYKEKHADDINFHRYVQYVAFTQWQKIKDYANENDVKIVGDIPIYVSPDGADLWGDPRLFNVSEDMTLEYFAGVPGDDFAPDGQLWGNPLYNWDYHKKTGYEWWMLRMKKCLDLFDMVRVDHFRAFDEYFSIPAEDKNADRGKWLPGPGMDLVGKLTKEFGTDRFIAEDLGVITDSVTKLLSDSKMPGMKVMQFAYSGDAGNVYLPHHHIRNSVVYTGTHDNHTTLGWIKTQKEVTKKVREQMSKYHGFPEKLSDKELAHRILCVALSSGADTCIIPLQDYLLLEDDARMNIPSTVGGINWQWRVDPKLDYKALSKEILELNDLYGR